MGQIEIHVLTIGSDTFIADLRIRPVKKLLFRNDSDQIIHDYSGVSSSSVQVQEYQTTTDNVFYKWNLEIRRVRPEDSGIYYCLLNSENLYGRSVSLTVLCKYKIEN